MNEEPKFQSQLIPMNEMNIRRKCIEWTLELVKSEVAASKGTFGFCGMQDLKCQIVDCAKALSDFLLEGKTADSIVGMATLQLAASRLLKDRGITLSVQAFNELMKAKGLMTIRPLVATELTKEGLMYGKMKPGPQSYPIPYYYDDKFDELLLLLGITETKEVKDNPKPTTRAVQPSKKSKQ